MSVKPSEMKGMVSEERLKEQMAKAQGGETPPTPEVCVYLQTQILFAINKNLEELVKVFKGSSVQPKAEQTKSVPVSAPVTTPVTAPKPEPQPVLSPRIQTIMDKFVPFDELVRLDTEESALFVMVRPRAYLGAENFQRVAAVVKELNGQYISQGKDSHFQISKQES